MAPKPTVRITAVIEHTDGEEYSFTVHSEKEGITKAYSADLKLDALRTRNTLIKQLKERDYIVLQ